MQKYEESTLKVKLKQSNDNTNHLHQSKDWCSNRMHLRWWSSCWRIARALDCQLTCIIWLSWDLFVQSHPKSWERITCLFYKTKSMSGCYSVKKAMPLLRGEVDAKTGLHLSSVIKAVFSVAIAFFIAFTTHFSTVTQTRACVVFQSHRKI